MWWEERMAAFDIESTGVEPLIDRVVTAALVLVGGGRPTESYSWQVNPGVEIPEGASKIHGITNEKAAAFESAEVVIPQILDEVRAAASHYPIVVFNANYDLTMLAAEATRHGLDFQVPERVVDPFVIDKHLDRYRKGSRKLEAICKTYGAKLDAAHDADADAIAAARAAWVLGTRGRIIRKAWNPEMYRENAVLEREWEDVRYDLDKLHGAQARWYRDSMESLREYFIEKGDEEAAQDVSTEWPIRAS